MLEIPWVTLIDLSFSFSLDGLGLLFSLLISFFGILVICYASEYLKHHRDLGKFYLFILIFMFSMLGVVLSDHLLLLFIFWELTTFSSFLLIGLDHDKDVARTSAWQAILITTAGGLAMMAGLLMLGSVCGTYRISEILELGAVVKESNLYYPILVLILLGAFTKSAQFPFSFWLPAAMAAPTPVSAYLHSATMVKAGIYLMARLSPVLAGTSMWFGIVSSVGAITMITAGIMALKQDDLKLLLAHMTVMALGLMTLLLGIGNIEALKAALIFLVVHSLYKGALFFVTGSLDHANGTRKVSELGGLITAMPWTATAALLSLLAMGGFPPVLG
ncbi:MAG: Na(+)/H(+) antiporter subunit A, partial [Bdellovibrionales bacterium]|nr:Na(+)/H(+) antiporter subunit A [Bdellovibrionales bacterium]